MSEAGKGKKNPANLWSRPSVKITPEALADLRLYVKLCDVEISGIGKVLVADDGSLVITEIILLPQRDSMGGTVLDEEGQAIFLEEISKRGGNPEDYRVWWHSHVTGGVFWSTVDTHTIDGFKYADFWVSILANQMNELRVRVDIFKPWRGVFDDLPMSLTEENMTREDFLHLMESHKPGVEKEMKEKIKKRPLLEVLKEHIEGRSSSAEEHFSYIE